MLGRLGPLEIMIIVGILVFLFGAKKIPELARGMGLDKDVQALRASLADGACFFDPPGLAARQEASVGEDADPFAGGEPGPWVAFEVERFGDGRVVAGVSAGGAVGEVEVAVG